MPPSSPDYLEAPDLRETATDLRNLAQTDEADPDAAKNRAIEAIIAALNESQIPITPELTELLNAASIEEILQIIDAIKKVRLLGRRAFKVLPGDPITFNNNASRALEEIENLNLLPPEVINFLRMRMQKWFHQAAA